MVASEHAAPIRKIAAAAVAGLVLCCLSVLVTLSGVDSGPAVAQAAGRALMVAAPVAVGCYAWYRRPQERFGVLLVAAGYGWFLTTLAESDVALLYSVGRIAGWLVELQLVYLTLSFPTGRLSGRIDRALVGTAAATVVLLYLPSALLADRFPLPAPYTSCVSDCPPNAFFVLDAEPGFVDSALRPFRELLTIVLFLAVTARLAVRVRHATHAMRRTLSPVLAVAVARALLMALALAARRVDASATATDALVWAIALALPLLAAGFYIGLLRWRLFVASALEKLTGRLRADLDATALRDALADALDDRSLELAYRVHADGGSWVDAEGRPVALPLPGSGRCVTEVGEAGRPIAAIVHDEALLDQGDLVEAAVSCARIALENQRLGAEVESSLRDVRESRARILAGADEERRRIERDLHDGAQQRLVALRIKLELTEELLRVDPTAGLEKLHSLGGDVEDTIDEIRSLARGVYPPLLADQGLSEALRAAALRSPVAATVVANGIGRYSQDIESAVYFCCLEALQNAAKHAQGATKIAISLDDRDALRFEVSDNGAGFDAGDGIRGVGPHEHARPPGSRGRGAVDRPP